MPDEPERSDPWSKRWLNRRSSRSMRLVWGTVFLAGFGGWLWLVAVWARHNGHADWVSDSPKPLYGVVAAATYWPAVAALWHGLYPADPRWLPWGNRDE